jgi:hypothetical protein
MASVKTAAQMRQLKLEKERARDTVADQKVLRLQIEFEKTHLMEHKFPTDTIDDDRDILHRIVTRFQQLGFKASICQEAAGPNEYLEVLYVSCAP